MNCQLPVIKLNLSIKSDKHSVMSLASCIIVAHQSAASVLKPLLPSDTESLGSVNTSLPFL